MMNSRKDFGNEQGERAKGAEVRSELHSSDKELMLEQALKNFKSSVNAWSAAELSRVRPAVKAKRQRSWRLAAGWALAGVLAAGGVSGGFYEHHEKELRIAAATRLAEQQRAAREMKAREDEEDLLAKVDSDVSRVVPSAMEPLVQLTDEGETR
ncbi:MAG: hypothetical protein ACLQLH_16575 [Terracidiphilus sp.]